VWRKDDVNSQTSPEVPSGSINSTSVGKPGSSPANAPISSKAAACISQGITIKGEVVGSEDLFIDGTVDGKITIGNAVVTVGPNAKVKAEITSRDLVLRGRSEGKFTASERIQIWSTARVQGDLKAERVSIEEGAEVRGKVEVGKETASTTETVGHSKKPQSNKASQVDTKTPSGAATAGAD
jgi:cytoskeletal protein CcmA (bactofilin family)